MTPTTARPTPTCYGCGKALSVGSRAFIKLPNDKEVHVCYGRGNYPSQGCTEKARKKADMCPGCGTPGFSPGTICSPCKTAIARGKAQQARELEWWCIYPLALAPEWGKGEGLAKDEDGVVTLARLLAEACAAGASEVHRGNGWGHNIEAGNHLPKASCDYSAYTKVEVELTPKQGAAFEELVKHIRRMMRLQYKTGFQHGDNALRRLATGDSSIKDYEEVQQKARDFKVED